MFNREVRVWDVKFLINIISPPCSMYSEKWMDMRPLFQGFSKLAIYTSLVTTWELYNAVADRLDVIVTFQIGAKQNARHAECSSDVWRWCRFGTYKEPSRFLSLGTRTGLPRTHRTLIDSIRKRTLRRRIETIVPRKGTSINAKSNNSRNNR